MQKKIWVFDYNLVFVLRLHDMLTSLGQEPFYLEYDEDPLEKYKRDGQEFSLIFMDRNFRDKKGIRLTKAIRAFEKKNHQKPIPIIGLGISLGLEDHAKLLEAGMNWAYSKPIKLDEIKEVLKKYLPDAGIPPG